MYKSFGFAFKGLGAVWKERNFKLHLFSAVAVILLGGYFRITPTEWLLIVISIGMVLGLEVVNTAIELLVDIVSPDFNDKAGKVKDLAAAAVLVVSIASFVIGLVIFLPYLY